MSNDQLREVLRRPALTPEDTAAAIANYERLRFELAEAIGGDQDDTDDELLDAVRQWVQDSQRETDRRAEIARTGELVAAALREAHGDRVTAAHLRDVTWVVGEPRLLWEILRECADVLEHG